MTMGRWDWDGGPSNSPPGPDWGAIGWALLAVGICVLTVILVVQR